jgi:hypothetical protein
MTSDATTRTSSRCRSPRAGEGRSRRLARVVMYAFAVGVAASLVTVLSAGATSHVSRLTPAPSPPLGEACSHSLFHDADGNVTPLLCSKNRFNVLAWRWYARNSPAPVLALARDATLSDVEHALCRVQNSTSPMRISEYSLASAYNRWHFSKDPVTLWESETCAQLLKGAT